MGDGTGLGAPAAGRRDMVLGAATIFERIAWAPATPEPDAPSTTAHLLDAWVKAYSPGNPAALLRRLSWDGLAPDDIRRAQTAREVPPAAADWTAWLDAYMAECRLGSAGGGAVGAPAPFAEILAPAGLAARYALEARVPAVVRAGFAPQAQGDLERQLVADLSAQTELALFEAFRHARDGDGAEADPSSNAYYRRFVARMLEGDLDRLFHAYPVMGRHVSLILEAWVTSTAELMTRLHADRARLAAMTGGDPGLVSAIEPALSDPHNGRRRVARLDFESGVTLVYKPRDVGLEAAFASFLEELAALGLDPAPRAPAMVEGHGYGWIEFVRPGPVATLAAADTWYRRAGAVLCAAHLLRGRDLHMENVIATPDGPVLIDLELLVQPVTAREQASATASPLTGERLTAGTCLTTGFVSDLQTAADGTLFDVGALRGDGSGMTPVSRRVWNHLGTDAVAFTNEPAFRIAPSNRPSLDGEPLAAEDHLDAVIDGFERTYRLIYRHRDALLAAGGAIERFAGHATRVIGRPTDQYAAMLHLLAAPRYQQSGGLRSVTLDALNRTFVTAESLPPLWALAQEERRSLESLDVPVFYARTDDRAVFTGGRKVVPEQFAVAGLEAVRARLVAMSDADLDVQLTSLQRALWDPLDATFSTPLVIPRVEGVPPPPGAEVVAHALWIAAELTALDAEPETVTRRVSDFYLYDGALGPALLEAAIAATTGDDTSRAAALAVVDRLDGAFDGDQESRPLGVCSGDGSLIYALTCIARLLDDPQPVALARRIAAAITPARIDADLALDISGGAAGAVLALLALHEHAPDPGVLATAVACGERLLATRQQHGRECGWLAADGRRYVGFAHGAAGIGVALTRLFRTTGRRDFLEAAAGAHQFEARLFQRAQGNWPVTAGNDGAPGEMMTAWCHGAPGIALARSLAAVALQDPALLADVTAALKTTAGVPIRLDDHLCCGSLGRCDALLSVGERFQTPAAVEAAWRMALAVVRRAEAEGRYRLTSRGYEFRAFDPGFFRGLSGIAYQLLRLAAPSRLPSVLSFDLPPVSPRS